MDDESSGGLVDASAHGVGQGALTQRPAHRWPGSAAGRNALWPWLLALATVVALLLAIHQVMQAAVLQGELLRKSHAADAEVAWRCTASRNFRLPDNCRARLAALPEPEAAAQDQQVAVIGTVR